MMQTLTSGHACPACGDTSLEVFFELPGVPVFCNTPMNTREDALAAPRGDIRLGFCGTCGMIYNTAFDPSRLLYAPHYENSLHWSPCFQQFVEQLALSLIDRYKLRRRHVVEIGCGQGDFLSLLCKLGQNYGTGFDPSYRIGLSSQPDGVTIHSDLFSHTSLADSADFLCCRHVLEHVQHPLAMLTEMQKAFGGRSGSVYCEVPHALYTFRDMGIWDILYEHCAYYLPSSLFRVFQRAGFEPVSVSDAFGHQFLAIEARTVADDNGHSDAADHSHAVNLVEPLVRRFAAAYHSKVSQWRNTILEMARMNKRIVVWGAGTKGAMFLNVINASPDIIAHVVDVNPRKQGQFVCGSGQQIVPPGALWGLRPDAVILMNPQYQTEVRQSLADLDLQPELLTA